MSTNHNRHSSTLKPSYYTADGKTRGEEPYRMKDTSPSLPSVSNVDRRKRKQKESGLLRLTSLSVVGPNNRRLFNNSEDESSHFAVVREKEPIG